MHVDTNLAQNIARFLNGLDVAVHFDVIEDRFYFSGTIERTLRWLQSEGDIVWNPATDMIGAKR